MKIKFSDDTFKKILKAVEKQKEEKAQKRAQKEFCPEWPHPTTWLNQERWNDVVEIDEDSSPEPRVVKAGDTSFYE